MNYRCIDLVGTHQCKCESGCKGNPKTGCTCPPSKVDGCQFKQCGPNAKCVSENGVGRCLCLSGYPHGNPEISCSSRPGGRNLILVYNLHVLKPILIS